MALTICLLCGNGRYQMEYSSGEARYCSCIAPSQQIIQMPSFQAGFGFKMDDGRQGVVQSCGRLVAVEDLQKAKEGALNQ